MRRAVPLLPMLALLGAAAPEPEVTLTRLDLRGIPVTLALPAGDAPVRVVVLLPDRRSPASRVEALLRTFARTGVAVVAPGDVEAPTLREESARREEQLKSLLAALHQLADERPRLLTDRTAVVAQGFSAVTAVRVCSPPIRQGMTPSTRRANDTAAPSVPSAQESPSREPPATSAPGTVPQPSWITALVLLSPTDLLAAGVDEGSLRDAPRSTLTVLTTPATRPATRTVRSQAFDLHPGPAYLLTLERVPDVAAILPDRVPAPLARQAEAFSTVLTTFFAAQLADDSAARDLLVSGSVIARFRPHAELEVK